MSWTRRAGWVLACALFCLPLRAAAAVIAVGIANKVKSVTLTPEGEYSVIDQATGQIRPLKRGAAYKVEADDGKIVFGPHLLKGAARVLPGKPGEHLRIGDRRYSGNIVFQANKGSTLTVIDEVDLEEYLVGVLPREMSPDWPVEALKAQAVVARTFALKNIGKHEGEGFDLTDDSSSQLYTGITDVSTRVAQAVMATAGQVLTYDGKLLAAYFHSTCGGHTISPAEIWGGAPVPPPLRGVSCRYCKYAPFYRWEAYFRGDDILRKLQSRWSVARLDKISTGREGSNGLIQSLNIKVDGNWKTLSANVFRLWLGPADLKSARLTKIVKKSRGWMFRGKGYGHGAGLCQWGARVMAVDKREYRTILKHYFPGSVLTKTNDGD